MKRGGVHSQEVTDAQGRRRFHGAFTGGFSAGYYNSVGSEEGWTPRTFSSSRGNRSTRIEQRPEDFMDDEDDPLLGKRLETTERYDTLQTGAKQRLQQQQQLDRAGTTAIPGFSLPDDWVLPVNESVGAKLLKQMGWKEGHGIGQRVRRRKFQDEEKMEQPKLLMQGVSGERKESELQDDVEAEVYVPPRKVFDVQKSFPKPKLDRYGAGFDPYRDAPEFSIYKQQQENKQKEKEGSHRQVVSFLDALKTTDGSNRATSGYGLSSLEENDDIDVYGSVSMAEFDRVIAPLGARKDVKRLDSSAQESRRHEKSRRSRALCSDGRPVLPGFELAATKSKPPKVVNLRLAVPVGFKSYHRFDDDEGQDDAVTALYREYNFSTNIVNNGMVVTAKQRSALLGDAKQDVQGVVDSAAGAGGEVQNSTNVRSVFDLLGEEQKARLFDVAAHAKRGLPLPGAMRAATTDEPAAPKVRQPLVGGSSGDQFRATISASIAKRFVSSKSSTSADKRVSSAAEEPQPKLSRRSQSSWIPKSLLCKRFHVKCVGPTGSNGKDGDNDKKRDLFDEELVPHLMEFAADRAAHRQSEDKAHETSKVFKAVEAKPAEDIELSPLPTVEKASIDLLKSIFELSDESEVSEEDSEDESDDDDKKDDESEVHRGAKEQGQFSSPSQKKSHSSREAVDVQRKASSEESSSSDDDDDISSSAGVSGSGNNEGVRGKKRSRSVDEDSSRNAKRQVKEEKRRHEKHKKHRKHRSSRDGKDKKRKKDKKTGRNESRTNVRRGTQGEVGVWSAVLVAIAAPVDGTDVLGLYFLKLKKHFSGRPQARPSLCTTSTCSSCSKGTVTLSLTFTNTFRHQDNYYSTTVEAELPMPAPRLKDCFGDVQPEAIQAEAKVYVWVCKRNISVRVRC